jgi:hypothetical protein
MRFKEFLAETHFKVKNKVQTPDGNGVIIKFLGKDFDHRQTVVVKLESGEEREFDMKVLRTVGSTNTFKKRDPSWDVLQAKRMSGAMGAHKDKKRDLELGKVKHRGRFEESMPVQDFDLVEE